MQYEYSYHKVTVIVQYEYTVLVKPYLCHVLRYTVYVAATRTWYYCPTDYYQSTSTEHTDVTGTRILYMPMITVSYNGIFILQETGIFDFILATR